MAGIQEAQQRWQSIRAKGRTRGIGALVAVVVVLLAIAALAGGNAVPVILVVVLVVVVIGAAALVLGKKQTGLSITPEWKPADTHEDDDFDEDDNGNDPPAVVTPSADDVEPIRRLDAQILGTDLTKLGQVVAPKLSKSYAMGYLVLTGPSVVWEPSVASAGQGIDQLSVAPAEVTSVERAPLWGSWALMRIATGEGAEWCLRIPGSVDLAPAFAELGLTVRNQS